MTFVREGIAIGGTIGHYTVLSSLGSGGMGEVYLAHDRTLDRQVALKVLWRDVLSDAERVQLFHREARALAALSHPNIVTVFAIEESSGGLVLVMEFIEGRTLRAALAPGGIPLDRFFAVAVPLADALAAAHEQGVTHRDLKPENVMVTRTGRVKVLDFGLAKISAREHPADPHAGLDSTVQTIARAGVLLGTIPYMSPEQAEGIAVDSRSDIFSLGVMLFEMLTGSRPFQGSSSAQIISSILRDTPPPVNTLRPEVSPDLARIVRRCLSKDPVSRYQSARDLHLELSELAEELRTPVGSGAKALQTPVAARVASGLSEVVRSGQSIRTRTGAALLLAGVALLNWMETALETAVNETTGISVGLRQDLARSMQWLEGGLSFERHDSTSALAVYGYSAAYFFAMPLLVLLALAASARRRDPRAFRVVSFALVFDYAISLPFYLFYPVPERWAFAEADAILLSDLWSSQLIEFLRPISALDNCLPSFHVSATVIVVLAAFLFQARYRTLTVPVGLAVIASTFALGIHWLADIVAGAAVGVLSLWLATRLDARMSEAKARVHSAA